MIINLKIGLFMIFDDFVCEIYSAWHNILKALCCPTVCYILTLKQWRFVTAKYRLILCIGGECSFARIFEHLIVSLSVFKLLSTVLEHYICLHIYCTIVVMPERTRIFYRMIETYYSSAATRQGPHDEPQ